MPGSTLGPWTPEDLRIPFLGRHPGQLVPRETLLRSIWGYGEEIRTRTLDVHICRLRKSLGNYGDMYIETIFGVGYRFQPCRAQAPLEASVASFDLSLRKDPSARGSTSQ